MLEPPLPHPTTSLYPSPTDWPTAGFTRCSCSLAGCRCASATAQSTPQPVHKCPITWSARSARWAWRRCSLGAWSFASTAWSEGIGGRGRPLLQRTWQRQASRWATLPKEGAWSPSRYCWLAAVAWRRGLGRYGGEEQARPCGGDQSPLLGSRLWQAGRRQEQRRSTCSRRQLATRISSTNTFGISLYS